VQHTEIFANGGLTITTANGMTVEYRETGNIQEDIAQLAQAPGLEWMAEVANRDDVNWEAVQEVHDQWKKEDRGIGGPGMQLVAKSDVIHTNQKVPVRLTSARDSFFASWLQPLVSLQALRTATAEIG